VILRRMREQGKTVIIITHKLSEVLAISDEVTVMRDGRVVGRVQTKDTNAAELARLMVGREVLLRVEKTEPKVGETELEIKNLSVVDAAGSRRVNDVSFEVRRGEIVGIAGVEGNGQTELIETLAGLVDPTRITGHINFEGRDLKSLGARIRRELGIVTSPKIVIDAGSCSTSVSRKTRFSEFIIARPLLLSRAGFFLTRTPCKDALRRSSRALTFVHQTQHCRRVRFPAVTSRS